MSTPKTLWNDEGLAAQLTEHDTWLLLEQLSAHEHKRAELMLNREQAKALMYALLTSALLEGDISEMLSALMATEVAQEMRLAQHLANEQRAESQRGLN